MEQTDTLEGRFLMLYDTRETLELDALAEAARLAQQHEVLTEFLYRYSERVAKQYGVIDACYLTLDELGVDRED